jgi:hypothetical protein
MAYQNKYKITYATKTTKTAYLYILEDNYVGSLIEYDGINIDLQYLPKSDEIYEALYSSQLNVTIDVTNDLANIPNLVTLNDRKYLAKLYLGANLEWIGWVLSDNVQITYSTGRKQLFFNCVDGLGMLKNIPLEINSVGNRTNTLQTVLSYILTCLNALDFPTNPNLVTVCSYFASGMNDREDGTEYEPFSQTYLPIRTF